MLTKQSARKFLAVSASLIFAVVFALRVVPTKNMIQAADVGSTVDLVEDATGPIDPTSVDTIASVATSTSDDFYFAFATSSGEFAGTDTVAITFPAGFTSLAECVVGSDDADEDSTDDGSMAVSGQTATYTFSAATTTANSGGVEFCVTATTPAATGNYSIAISTSGGVTDTTSGLIYVTDLSGENFVSVTANVSSGLSFSIRNASTTALENTCALGSLNPGAVNTCSYRLAAGTNNPSGLNVKVNADATLNNAGATADIDDVTDDVITPGEEEYGFRVTNWGSVPFVGEAGFWTTATATTSAEAIPTATTEQIYSASGSIDDSSATNWVTVEHAASISGGTTVDTYDQIVEYSAFAGT